MAKKPTGAPVAGPLIDRIVQIRKDTRRRIEVPEWAKDGEAAPVLYFAVLTTADVTAVRDRMINNDGRDPEKHRDEERVNLLIQKAELEDGARAFEWGHRDHLLQNCEWAVLQRLIAFMYRSSFSGSVDEAQKKSETTAGSGSGSPSESD